MNFEGEVMFEKEHYFEIIASGAAAAKSDGRGLMATALARMALATRKTRVTTLAFAAVFMRARARACG